MAYEKTGVTVSRSQEQIRDVLRKHRATRTNFGEDFREDGSAVIGVEFVYTDTLVRMMATVKPVDEKEFKRRVGAARSKTPEQIRHEMSEDEARRMWRVLHWAIKVRMEAVEEGLETFEQSFLAHLVDPSNGKTLWDRFFPAIDAGAMRIGQGGLLALNAG